MIAPPPDSPGGRTRSVWLAALVCLVFFAALAYLVHLRQLGTYWTESDLYDNYAPDADRLLAGRFPDHSIFHPPGYPALLAALFPLTGDHFVTGKWLSLMAGALSGLVAFLLFRRCFGEAAALLGVGIILLSGEYTSFAIQATTDVVFLLVCLVTMLVLTDDRMAPGRWAVLLGMLSAVAYLVRSNGAFLVVPCLVAVLTRPAPRGRRAVWAAAYVGGLLLVAAPWLSANWIHRGSPFFSESYHNMGRHLYGEAGYRSLGDLVRRDPLRFLRRYAGSVGDTGASFLDASLWSLPVGPLAALGVVLGLRGLRRPVALLLLALLSHLLLVSLIHWESRYHFFAMAILSGFAAAAVVWIGAAAAARSRRPEWVEPAIVGSLALVLLAPLGARAHDRLRRTLEREPTEVLAASRALRALDPAGGALMSPKPHLAYLSGRPWRRLPHVPSMEALRQAVHGSDVRFVAWDRMGWRTSRDLGGILDNPSKKGDWLVPVYSDPPHQLVIYRVVP